MKLLYDYFPIVLFFITYKLYGIYAATMVAMAASIIQVALFWIKHRRFETMHLVSMSLIVVLGGLTLILRDKAFIMWKPTLVNWAFAAVFLITSFVGEKPLIRRMLGAQLELPKKVWKRLNVLWIAFFLVSGATNIYFVKSFQSAELALSQAAPTLDKQQLSDLNCETDLPTKAQPLCLDARNKENTWVQFKLFGMLGLTFIFVIIQGFYLYRFMQPAVETRSDDT
jgi:intracellular septation protein